MTQHPLIQNLSKENTQNEFKITVKTRLLSQTFLVGFDPQQLNYKIYKLSDNKTTDKSGERNTQLF